MQTCWTVGYVIGEIPSNIMLTRVRPSIWIPAMEVSTIMLWRVLMLTGIADMGCPYFLSRKGE
jgi:hypothetical protein